MGESSGVLTLHNYRQLTNIYSGRISLPQGRPHQWVTQYQTVNPENTHIGSTIRTEMVVFLFLTTVKEKVTMNLKAGKVHGRVWRKERERGNSIIYK